jgi:chromosome segregation ATPase
MTEALTSLKAATSLAVAAGFEDQAINPYYLDSTNQTLSTTSSSYQQVHTKYALQKLKEGNVYEKSELQRLNHQLHSYLENVKMLESLNRSLMTEVDKVKDSLQPDYTVSEKQEWNSNFEHYKLKLQHEQVENLNARLKLEDGEKLAHLLNQRIQFFQNETETTRNRIQSLQKYLYDIENQRENLVRGAQSAQEDINREFDRQLMAEQDIENLRAALKEAKHKNKKIEYEIKTMLDMVAFYKHAYAEEVHTMRSGGGQISIREKGGVLSNLDLNNFYKTELEHAIQQIRQDFETLNNQQLREYKIFKENELNMILKQVEHDRALAEQTRSKIEQSAQHELQSMKELQSHYEKNRQELSKLNAHHAELLHKLSHLEEHYDEYRKRSDRLGPLQAEIEQIKQENELYAHELEYWESVQRVRLDAEIQAYRSLLNSQLKLLQSANSSTSSINTTYNYNFNPQPVPPPPPINIQVPQPYLPPSSQPLTPPQPRPQPKPVTTYVYQPSKVVVNTTLPSASTSSLLPPPPISPQMPLPPVKGITETSASSSIVRGANKYEDKVYYSDKSRQSSSNLSISNQNRSEEIMEQDPVSG